MLSRLKESTFIQTFLFGAYLVSGLILNALQAIVYVTVRPFNKRLFRTINRYLIYANWAQVVSLGQSWSGSKCRVWFEDTETMKNFGTEHGLIVMNHSYEIDFIYCWLVCDAIGCLPECKTFAKKMIAYVPVMGWNWLFGEMIFLEREWEKDRDTLPQKLDNVLGYEDPMLLLMFCEGTRFTAGKHQASLEFAKKNGLPELKYHLLPRPKGFAFCANYFHGKVNYIYDIELCIPKNSPNPPTLISLLNGKPGNADMYIRRHAIKDLPEDEEKLKEFLYDVYKKKDELTDYYHSNQNKFPEGSVELDLKPRLIPTLLHTLVVIAFTIPTVNYAAQVFWFNPSIAGMIGCTTSFGILYGALWKMVGLTQTSSTSSAYGTKKADSKKKE